MGRSSGAPVARRLQRISAPMNRLSREVPIDPTHAALLIVDVQNYCAHANGAAWRGHAPAAYFFRTLREVVILNLQRLQSACRRAHIEIVYAAVENMTRDGRDRSLDYKISGIDVPRGSWEARVLDEIALAEDEMIFRKTSSSVFISTNIDYILRNLEVRSLIVAGMMTDQCVESAVAALIRGAAGRFAADQPRPIGFLVLRHPLQFR